MPSVSRRTRRAQGQTELPLHPAPVRRAPLPPTEPVEPDCALYAPAAVRAAMRRDREDWAAGRRLARRRRR